jgi:hypothetical protein
VNLLRALREVDRGLLVRVIVAAEVREVFSRMPDEAKLVDSFIRTLQARCETG